MAYGGRGMTYIHRTLIVPAEHAPLARSLAAHLAGPPGDGMWVVGLSEDGSEPATHYVSSGPVGAEFAPMLTDADALWGAVQAATETGTESPMSGPSGARSVTQDDCEALVADSIVVDLADEGPFDTFTRLGLQLVQEQEDV